MSKLTQNITLSFLFFALVPLFLIHANEIEGPYPDFTSARAAGLGNAMIAASDGGFSSFWNPAGMLRMPSVEFDFQQNQPRDNLKYDPKLIAIKHKVWAFSWANKIAIAGNGTYDFTYTAISRYFSAKTAHGISLIWKRRHPVDYFQYLGDYYGFLYGGQYFINSNLRVGLTAEFKVNGDILIMGAGIAKQFKALLLTADVKRYKTWRANIGTEYLYKFVKLRAGFDSVNGPTAGAGIKININSPYFYGITSDLAYIFEKRDNVPRFIYTLSLLF